MPKGSLQHIPVRTLNDKFTARDAINFSIEKIMPDQEGEGVRVAAHRHDYYHVMYIRGGLGKHSIDFKTYELLPNSLFFVSPGQVHSVTIDKNVDAYVLSFNSDFIALNSPFQKLLDYPFFHSLYNAPVLYFTNDHQKIHHLIDELYEEYHDDSTRSENLLRALLETLLIRASRLYSPNVTEDQPNHLTYQLRKLETYIDEHFKSLKQLNDYADLMHLSPKHLNSLCKTGLNKTVMNLIHERTLLEAKRLLLFTDNSIAEIAFELGFADKSYFMRFFKKHTSYTADAFRQKKN